MKVSKALEELIEDVTDLLNWKAELGFSPSRRERLALLFEEVFEVYRVILIDDYC